MDPAFFRRGGGAAYADSDQSSSVMGAYNPYKTYGGRSGQTGFNSARLVKNAAESRRHSAAPMSGHHGSSRELDREGRMIRSECFFYII